MKATLFAVLLSCFSLSLPGYAADAVVVSASPVVEQKINKINLNQADLSSLIGSFKGIGKKRAEAIISYREAHDGFKSVSDLSFVRGLGQSFVNKHLSELEQVFTVG
jgi:competence protein ComEA